VGLAHPDQQDGGADREGDRRQWVDQRQLTPPPAAQSESIGGVGDGEEDVLGEQQAKSKEPPRPSHRTEGSAQPEAERLSGENRCDVPPPLGGGVDR